MNFVLFVRFHVTHTHTHTHTLQDLLAAGGGQRGPRAELEASRKEVAAMKKELEALQVFVCVYVRLTQNVRLLALKLPCTRVIIEIGILA